MFDNFNVNLRKKVGFLTYIPRFPIPEYGESNAPLETLFFNPLPGILQEPPAKRFENLSEVLDALMRAREPFKEEYHKLSQDVLVRL